MNVVGVEPGCEDGGAGRRCSGTRPVGPLGLKGSVESLDLAVCHGQGGLMSTWRASTSRSIAAKTVLWVCSRTLRVSGSARGFRPCPRRDARPLRECSRTRDGTTALRPPRPMRLNSPPLASHDPSLALPPRRAGIRCFVDDGPAGAPARRSLIREGSRRDSSGNSGGAQARFLRVSGKAGWRSERRRDRLWAC